MDFPTVKKLIFLTIIFSYLITFSFAQCADGGYIKFEPQTINKGIDNFYLTVGNDKIFTAISISDKVNFQNQLFIPTHTHELFITVSNKSTLLHYFDFAHFDGSYTLSDFKIDNKGNFFVCGYYEKNAIFDTINLPNADPKWNFFVAKIDSMGKVIWANYGGTPQSYDEARALNIDSEGNVYVTGSLYGYSAIDTFNFNCSGGAETFVGKYTKDGVLIWANIQPYGGQGSSILIDKMKKIFVAGINIIGVSPGIFLAQLDSNGNYEWMKRGQEKWANAPKIIFDDAENILISLKLTDTLIFDGYTDTIYPSFPSGSIWLSGIIGKLNHEGNPLWFKKIENCQLATLNYDKFNNEIWLGGSFKDSLVYDSMNIILRPNNSGNLFAIKVDTNGNYKYSIASLSSPGNAGFQFTNILSNDLGNTFIGSYYSSSTLTDSLVLGTNVLKQFQGGFIWNLCSTDTISSGFTENSRNSNYFLVFPNPAHENFTFEINSAIKNGEIKIFNVLGKNVRALILNPSPKGERLLFQVDGRNLPSGIYFYKITNEKREMIGNGKVVIE